MPPLGAVDDNSLQVSVVTMTWGPPLLFEPTMSFSLISLSLCPSSMASIGIFVSTVNRPFESVRVLLGKRSLCPTSLLLLRVLPVRSANEMKVNAYSDSHLELGFCPKTILREETAS